MARNIKIELELPEFENSLNISVTLTKDGEHLVCSSRPEGVKTSVNNDPTSVPVPPREIPVSTPSRPNSGFGGGNMMNLNF